jgi:hypothetical protein
LWGSLLSLPSSSTPCNFACGGYSLSHPPLLATLLMWLPYFSSSRNSACGAPLSPPPLATLGNALQAAARIGRAAIVQVLLDRGADVNFQGTGGGGKAQQASYSPAAVGSRRQGQRPAYERGKRPRNPVGGNSTNGPWLGKSLKLVVSPVVEGEGE